MPHISPRKVHKKILEDIYSALFSAITNRKLSRKEQQSAFYELLTRTEKIMLGKRLAAISLLSQGMSPYLVGKTLQLSPTTAAKFQAKLEQGKLSHVEKLCQTGGRGSFERYIEELLKPLPRYGTSPSKIFKERLDS